MLEKIRAKPDHIKKTIALASTTGIFSLVLFVWWSSWDARINEDQVREESVSPLASITSMLSGLTSDIKTSYSNTINGENNSTTEQTSTTTASRARFDMASVVVLDPTVAVPVVLASTTATTTRK